MPKRFYKHKLLLDEHLHDRRAYPTLNEHFDVKHVALDLHDAGLKDPQVYELAVTTGRILVTRNARDFRPLVGTKKDAGVIAIPPHALAEQLDRALAALLMRHGP